MPFPLASGNESVEMSEEDNREWETETEAPATEAGSHSDIYAEDGSVRHDFLASLGAAIADRDAATALASAPPLDNRHRQFTNCRPIKCHT